VPLVLRARNHGHSGGGRVQVGGAALGAARLPRATLGAAVRGAEVGVGDPGPAALPPFPNVRARLPHRCFAFTRGRISRIGTLRARRRGGLLLLLAGRACVSAAQRRPGDGIPEAPLARGVLAAAARRVLVLPFDGDFLVLPRWSRNSRNPMNAKI